MSIKELIRSQGSIDIANFMKEVMFNPLLGYYKTKNPIGKDRDFITAPEICSSFSILIAKYVISIASSQAKANQNISIVEMGAGKGTLFHDLLQTLHSIANKNQEIKKILTRTNFSIIETNPKLVAIQKNKLKGFQVDWYSDFQTFEDSRKNDSIYFIANELFDCLPTHQFSKQNNKWQEIVLKTDNDGNIIKALEPFNSSKHQLIDNIYNKFNSNNSEQNIIFEHSFQSIELIEQISRLIKKNSGMALIIDYGYTKNPGKSTLQAIKNHEKIDIFNTDNPYQCDLTALVDFAALSEKVNTNGLNYSLVTQREFLQSLGIKHEMEKVIKNSSDEDLQKITSAFARLTSSDQMGDLFKCLIFWQD